MADWRRVEKHLLIMKRMMEMEMKKMTGRTGCRNPTGHLPEEVQISNFPRIVEEFVKSVFLNPK